MATLPCPQTLIGPNATPGSCPGAWQFLYAGACNCDAGFWCGCSSTNPLDCWPSNDSDFWVGQYTNRSADTNEVMVWSRNTTESRCAPSLYCPGDEDADACPELCPNGNYCPTPANLYICPKGYFCPRGSTSPRDCPRLSWCSEGEDYFSSVPLVLLVASLCIVTYSSIFWRQSNLVINARSRRIAATSKQSDGLDVGLSNTVADTTHNCKGKVDAATSLSFSSFNLGSQSKAARMQRISIKFEGLRLTLPNGGPTILHEINGAIPTGKITAIMGPSGAGKSTFLNVMAGKVQRTGGTVHINGVLADLEEYKGIIGFVPQDDTMLRELTAEEVITHSAYMRLPADMPLKEKDELIRDVIDSLGLTCVQDSIIGDELKRGISGGQRKRVSVGIEIVAMPSFLCLDEPTSGLDSVASLALVKTLKELAMQGVTIIAVLHQPKYDIFQLFDNVLLLGIGGCTVYLGAASDMKRYFEMIGFIFPYNSNPADYCMDIIAGLVEREGHPDFVKEDLFALWNEYCNRKSRTSNTDIGIALKSIPAEDELKPDGQYLETGGTKEDLKYNTWDLCNDLVRHMFRNMQFRNKFRKGTSFWTQFKLLFYRSMLQRLHTISSLPLLMALLAGCLIGIANFNLTYTGIPDALTDSIVGEAYLIQNLRMTNTIPNGWSNISLAVVLVAVPGIEVFGLERANFFREASTGLHVTAYWLARTVNTLLWIPLYSLVFSTVIYSLSPFYSDFYHFWLIVLMTYVGFYATGMIVSTVVSRANRGIVALVTGLVLTFATSGVAMKYGESNVQEIFWLFFPFWNAQAFVSNEYAKRSPPYEVADLNDPKSGNSNPFAHGYDLDSSFARNIGFAALTASVWHALVLVFLKFIDWRKQR